MMAHGRGYETAVGAYLQANLEARKPIRLQASSHSGVVATSEFMSPRPEEYTCACRLPRSGAAQLTTTTLNESRMKEWSGKRDSTGLAHQLAIPTNKRRGRPAKHDDALRIPKVDWSGKRDSIGLAHQLAIPTNKRWGRPAKHDGALRIPKVELERETGFEPAGAPVAGPTHQKPGSPCQLRRHFMNPGKKLERETRFELATPTLARLCSTS